MRVMRAILGCLFIWPALNSKTAFHTAAQAVMILCPLLLHSEQADEQLFRSIKYIPTHPL